MRQTSVHTSAGFTIVEIILVGALMVMLVTLSFPAITQLLEVQQEREEIARGEMIIKAMEAFIAENNDVPAAGTWADDLAQISNLSPEQIQIDVYGQNRVYQSHIESQTYRDATFDVFYVSVASTGQNVAQDATPTFTWAAAADPALEFRGLGATGDDVLHKYTDFPEKQKQYELTQQRLTKMSQALENYSKIYYAEALIANSAAEAASLTLPYPNISSELFFPPAAGDTALVQFNELVDGDGTGDGAINIGDFGGAVVNDTAAAPAAHRASMVGLARMMGLPDDHCCSALQNDTDGLPQPFYYYPNPRPQLPDDSCGAKPDGTAIPRLPPRLTASPYACGR